MLKKDDIMMRLKLLLPTLALTLAWLNAAEGGVFAASRVDRLPAVIGDNMVLQSDSGSQSAPLFF